MLQSQGTLPDRVYRQVLHAVGHAAVATDLEGHVIYWSPEAERLYGWTQQEAMGRRPRDLVLPADQPPLLAESTRRSMLEGVRYDGDWEVVHRDGRRLTVHCSAARILDDDGLPFGFLCLAHDVTARRAAHEDAVHLADALSMVERRWRAHFETPGLAQVICDPAGRILQANAAVCALFERRPEEVLGRFTADFHHPGDLRAGEQVVLEPGHDGATWERVFALPDGSPLPLLVTMAVVRNSAGEPESTLSVLQDMRRVYVLEEAAREAALEQQRHRLHDPLTGLGNRQLLEARLATDARRALQEGRPVSVLVLGLDAFRLVNDSHGHDVGDRLLQVVAGRLSELVGAGDTLVRVGGDSFALLAPGLDAYQARALAERLRVAVARPADLEDATFRVAASVGLASAQPHAEWSHLLRGADTALHEAKSHGGDRVEVFVAAFAEAASARLRLLSELRTALETGTGLRLEYQPQVDLASGRTIGAEALARWSHGELGELAPGDFVPLALAHGLGAVLDTWALRTAVRDLAAVRSALGGDVTLSVNVTTASLISGLLVDEVEALAVPPDALVLELTEHLLLVEPEPARVAIERLHELGVTVSVDDFGTGASTLQSVVELPVRELKIDRSFVAEVARDRGAHAVAASIAALARALGLRVVAEGVETPAQAQALRRLGVATGQGWLWSPAVPLGDLGRERPVEEPDAKSGAPAPRASSWFPATSVTDEHGLFLMLRLAADGLSATSVAAALNTAGWRTPLMARWHRTTVARVLREHAEAQSTR